MKKNLLLSSLLLIYLSLPINSAPMQGGVEKEFVLGGNSIVDSETNLPVPNAKISLPLEGFATQSDAQGRFDLNATVKGPTVLSIEKEGYRPFSITIDKFDSSKPLVIAIDKSTLKDITLDTQMFHLGDNSFSNNSANAREFQVKTIGPYYTNNRFHNRA